MTPPHDRTARTGLAIMAVAALWSALLGGGFAVVAVIALDELSPLRLTIYVVLAALLLLFAARTCVELVRRMRRGVPPGRRAGPR